MSAETRLKTGDYTEIEGDRYVYVGRHGNSRIFVVQTDHLNYDFTVDYADLSLFVKVVTIPFADPRVVLVGSLTSPQRDLLMRSYLRYCGDSTAQYDHIAQNQDDMDISSIFGTPRPGDTDNGHRVDGNVSFGLDQGVGSSKKPGTKVDSSKLDPTLKIVIETPPKHSAFDSSKQFIDEVKKWHRLLDGSVSDDRQVFILRNKSFYPELSLDTQDDETVDDILKTLNRTLLKTESKQIVVAWAEIKDYSRKESETMTTYIGRFKRSLREVADTGLVFADKVASVIMFLAAMLDSVNTQVALGMIANNFSMQRVEDTLLALEGDPPTEPENVFASKGKGKSAQQRPNYQYGGSSSSSSGNARNGNFVYKNVQCHNCGGWGHFQSVCPSSQATQSTRNANQVYNSSSGKSVGKVKTNTKGKKGQGKVDKL